MPENYGMLGNIASGIKEGLIAYQTQKANQRQEQMLKMQQLQSGIQENPETGELGLTPEAEQAKNVGRQKLAAESEEYQPGSASKAYGQGLLNKYGLAPEASIHAFKQVEPILSAQLHNEAMAKALSARNTGQERRLGIQEDTQSAKAVDKIHKDPQIMQFRQQATNIDRGMELLNDPSKPPSMTTMHEIAQDYAQALSGKGIASDFKVKSIDKPTFEGQLANIESYVKSNPNQPAPPEVVKFWRDMGERLGGAYQRQLGSRAKGLLSGNQVAYKHNPNALDAMNEAASLYSTGKWKENSDLTEGAGQQPSQGLIGRQSPAGNQHPQDDAALAWAKANINNPQLKDKAQAILRANGL